ncbi:Endoribonuclease YbeY [Candidatus Kinetoplastibacterium sorsogonicusi]|uniref:Endoribonuclease YbeY n=1 Tax=Candidatus Kinetoplastidibacterium kentomonadis TaxID=1576550 RepID=A0A3Q8EWR2_9PROT|nr:rRNA maturation RNase YbeY [Candidatus Kinetoplastibacterium sorsogonicusi]AWD32253.1 Endoribonuclease YbeY [Candidatus Kinetoplastibacterium sorsogonicusi]
MKINISIQYSCKKIPIKKINIKNIILIAIKFLKKNKLINPIKALEILVKITNADEITYLNKKYRNINKATNVLTFEYGIENQILRSDIILCLSILNQEAEFQNKNIIDHMTHIIIHGLLHSLGYDHINDQDAEIMEKIEIDILNILNINNPYF